mmetsp:Transcript_49738/g.118466  ORF Transcript_49738/g.118466 Transcript_49738/m.118466 type:complete len:263 (-) Transcript_49738:13-801(-)
MVCDYCDKCQESEQIVNIQVQVPSDFYPGRSSPQDVDDTSVDGTLETPSPVSDIHLSLDLEDSTLLRATRLVHVLEGRGKHLKANSLARDFSAEEATVLINKSHNVEQIDVFISHCWQDHHTPKVFALLIHSNLRAAVCISAIVACISASLCRIGVLPKIRQSDGFAFFPWALLFGSSTFFLILMTWHRVRDRCSFSTQYFLDKFCVHQEDDTLKERGVRSFAAFVAASDRMVLLWSPTYFTRLWCTLEMAAMVKVAGSRGF